MKKKLLSLALVLIMVLTLLPTAAFAEEDIEDLITQTDEIPAADEATEEDENGEGSGADNTQQQPVTCTGQEDCAATSHNADCVSQCSKNDNCKNTPGTASVHKSGCPKAAASTAPACNHVVTGGTLAPMNASAASPAACIKDGVKAYYHCSECEKYFIADALSTPLSSSPSNSALRIPATGHKAPSGASNYTAADISSSQHTYTCTVCKTTGLTESHNFSSNVCTVCGFERTVTPTPSDYINITSVYVNRYSIDVTWRSDAPSGTDFDIYVDGTREVRRVSPSKSGGYFSYTVDFSSYLGDRYYDVRVRLSDDSLTSDTYRVYNRYYDDDYYRPGYNGTPSTNSSGIPYASQVTGRTSASEAIRILRNKNSYTLQNDLMSSSSALSSFESLENAVKRYNNVDFDVSIDRNDVPSAFRSSSDFKVVGAAFNASRTNSTVRLVVDAPSQTRYTGYGYQFSMTLTGVDNARSLDVPVVVTLPLPSDISSSTVRVLHYHGSNSSPTVIEPRVSGRKITFPLTGFSDFVVTDNRGYYYGGGYVPSYTPSYGPGAYVSDGYGYVWVPGAGTGYATSQRQRDLMQEHLRIVLPIIASMPPSGYVYNDVPGTYWAAAPIAWAKDIGIMSGYSDGNFRPTSGTTRQELWMVLARLAGANPADMWAARQWAIGAGISDGTNPHSPLSTQQMIAMLYRYAQYRGFNTAAPANLGFYRDGAAVSPYARTAMSWAANWGIVVGDGDNCLNPENIATRADFATYLYRFLS